jgi:hypothetical protein
MNRTQQEILLKTYREFLREELNLAADASLKGDKTKAAKHDAQADHYAMRVCELNGEETTD